MIELKAGDVVRCVEGNSLSFPELIVGNEYTVSEVGVGAVTGTPTCCVAELPGAGHRDLYQSRFQLLRRPVTADSPLVVGPPEAVEAEKADEGPRWGQPHKEDDCNWLGRFGEYDLWHCDSGGVLRFFLRDKNSVPYKSDSRALYRWDTPSMDWHHEAIRRAKAKGLISDWPPEQVEAVKFSEADKLKAEIASLQAHLIAEQCQVKELRKKSAELEAEAERSRLTIKMLEAARGGESRERRALDARWTELMSEHLAKMGLKSDAVGLNGILHLIEDAVEGRDKKIAELEAEVARIRTNNESLNRANINLARDVAEAKAPLEAENARLRYKLSQVERSVRDLGATLASYVVVT